jgi:hypothetical protein
MLKYQLIGAFLDTTTQILLIIRLRYLYIYCTILLEENSNYLIQKKIGGLNMVHLVYCDNEGKSGDKVLDKILAGTKTMVVRGAAGRKIPHSRVFEGETLYFMQKGTGEITATATVAKVENYVKLAEDEIDKIIDDNQSKLNLSPKQKERWHKKCLCLVEFKDIMEISPLEFDHQGNMDDWLIIDKIEDVVVGTSIPYNYEKSKF